MKDHPKLHLLKARLLKFNLLDLDRVIIPYKNRPRRCARVLLTVVLVAAPHPSPNHRRRLLPIDPSIEPPLLNLRRCRHHHPVASDLSKTRTTHRPLFRLSPGVVRGLVYPDLVYEFYSNTFYQDRHIGSFVKNFEIILDMFKIVEALGYHETGIYVFTYGKWNKNLGVDYLIAVKSICENFAKCTNLNPTHKALGPVNAQLHRIINHYILPQSGSFQRVTFLDTLVHYALLNRISISFGYLMMCHMFECVKSEKKNHIKK
ncbi:hypothetical protein PIB30_042823 [Stylosanthes scabra]|uniref:Uncharacterized protein n=1 Tax=Stylosanthes scabra TaxID=79078 RepID=A0ABU6UGN2_9FABA|nr:hypothetical protein [Stylosanthes scabra]